MILHKFVFYYQIKLKVKLFYVIYQFMNEQKITCAYCGIDISKKDVWPHVDGDLNLGVKKIDFFCSEDHKFTFLSS